VGIKYFYFYHLSTISLSDLFQVRVTRGVRDWRSSLVELPHTLIMPAAVTQPTVSNNFVRVTGHHDLLARIFDRFREGQILHPHVLEPAKRTGQGAKCWYAGIIHPVQRSSKISVPSSVRLRAVGSQPRMWDLLDIDLGKPRIQHWVSFLLPLSVLLFLQPLLFQDVPSDLLGKMDNVFHDISAAHLSRKVKGYILQNLALPHTQMERLKVPKLPGIFFTAMVKEAPDTYK